MLVLHPRTFTEICIDAVELPSVGVMVGVIGVSVNVGLTT